MEKDSLIICHDCDLIQREVALEPGGVARCRRCNGILYRNSPDSMNRTLAFTIAAAVLFALANTFPILGIEMQGTPNATNLYGAVLSLWDQDMRLISFLVGVTTILIPGTELSVMLYLLLHLRARRVPPGIPLFMRILQHIRPWSMVEVFMLGILVALVKLKSSSTIIPGVALWSFGGLTFMLAAVAASFNPHDFWNYLEITSPGEGEEGRV